SRPLIVPLPRGSVRPVPGVGDVFWEGFNGPGWGGGKRKVDLHIELVPFIDMLAMMITFLMMTAVWTELGKIQVSQAATGASESNAPPKPTLQLNLTVTERSYLLQVGSEMTEIPKTAD